MLRKLITTLATALALGAGAARAQAPGEAQIVAHGLFAQVAVYQPRGGVQQVVLLLSDDDGPGEAERTQARALAAQGALVAVVDTPAFVARLDAEGATCGYPAGAFENLSRHLQAFFKLPGGVRKPLLLGRGAGGALAYAMLAQADSGTFGGALSQDFCPQLPFRQPLCAAHALPASRPASVPSVFDPTLRGQPLPAGSSRLAPAARLPAPWLVLQTEAAPACAAGSAQAFVGRVQEGQWRRLAPGDTALASALQQGYTQLAAHNAAPPAAPASLADLPVVEVPSSVAGQRYAVLVSGDGGWAAIDKAIAGALAARGIPVAGFDSLRYFWSARTPEGLAADLDRMVRFYGARWGRSQLLLIGFSQGADVLPFAFNRMDPDSRGRTRLTVLLSPGQKASFEFKVTNWLGPGGTLPVLPEAQKLDPATTLCVHGRDDEESLCPSLARGGVPVLTRSGGHHFDGRYEALVEQILSNLR
ncbi:virulence factor family protein [Rubrivivax gelatinosus]|uniref:Bacterial virulence domain-containing protein n=1 Tax=Rubrivivax gelatinosus TaxID=28068 RepID=A0ABS1DRT0_RUBGE|nr:virulence factor family protein [Rubrivivax gelatinosus]MBK1712648.1 hypothetical protein [Rubrivivax gelatinosus]